MFSIPCIQEQVLAHLLYLLHLATSLAVPHARKYIPHLCRCARPLGCVMPLSCLNLLGSCWLKPLPMHSMLSSKAVALLLSCSLHSSRPATTWRNPHSARSARWQSITSRYVELRQSCKVMLYCKSVTGQCLSIHGQKILSATQSLLYVVHAGPVFPGCASK